MGSRWLFAGLGGATVIVALALEPAAVFPQLRGSWFFDARRVETLRWALAGLGVALALGPRVREWLRREPVEAEDTRGTRWSDLAFVGALALMALALEWRSGPVSEDTKFYLGEALELAERGGLRAFVASCFEGSWTEDNRHPLYLMLLVPWAGSTNAMLLASKLVSFVGAALALLVVLRACRRRGGELGALAAGALLVTNASFVEFAVLTACESWWILFAVLALDLATREDEERGTLRWLAAGACLGLAFLAKGTAVLLALALGLAILWNRRRASWRALLPLALGFLATGLPLLVRNQLRFGYAFHNVNSRHGFWLDRWEQFYDAEALAGASASTWFEHHGIADALSRLASGFVKQVAHAFEATQVIAPGGFGAFLGALALLALAVGVLRMGNRRERATLAFVLALWIASFAWYAQIASDRRFLAVLVPLLAPALASWTSRATDSSRRTLRLAMVGCTALCVVTAFVPALPFARPLRFRESNASRELHAWLLEREEAGRDVVYLLGPSSTSGFDWDRSLLATRLPRPEDDAALEQLLASSEGERVRYLIVEVDETAERAGSRWPQADGDEPPGWQLVAVFPAEAPQVFVYSR